MAGPFRIGFVTGATPDKWARTWRSRRRDPLELVPVGQAGQERPLRSGELDMCLVRLPVDRRGLHLIPLYDEVPVAVMGTEHVATVAEQLTTVDLADEQLVRPHESGWTPGVEQLAWPAMSVREAIDVVAGGTGVVIVPMSIARLHHRKDTTYRPVTDLSPTTIGLSWREENDDDRVQTFIGIVRGRTERSSRT
jgi:hypothetical protein